MAADRRRSLSLALSILVICQTVNGQNMYNPYMYGANNYYAPSMYNGNNWIQSQCHWGVRGVRSKSQYQCGTFYCPTMWFGGSQYSCPPPRMYSNYLQRCIFPAQLASTKCRGTRSSY